ncbi:hypothetical protein WN943_006849 [Citrus x changshan-huyou]
MGFTRHPLLSRKLVPWPLLLRLGSSQNFSDLLQPMQLHYLFSLLPCQELKIGKFMHLYQRGHERGQQHLLRYPYSIYGDTITLSKGLAPADPLYLAERDYQTYYVGSRHEQLFRVFPCSYSLRFLQAIMVLHLWTHICHLQGEKTWPQLMGKLLYATSGLSNYNRRYPYEVPKPLFTHTIV